MKGEKIAKTITELGRMTQSALNIRDIWAGGSTEEDSDEDNQNGNSEDPSRGESSDDSQSPDANK